MLGPRQQTLGADRPDQRFRVVRHSHGLVEATEHEQSEGSKYAIDTGNLKIVMLPDTVQVGYLERPRHGRIGGGIRQGVEHLKSPFQQVDGPLVGAGTAKLEGLLRLLEEYGQGHSLVEATVHVVTERIGGILKIARL